MNTNEHEDELAQLRRENLMLKNMLAAIQHPDSPDADVSCIPWIKCNDDTALYENLPFELLEKFVSPILNLLPHHIVFVDAKGIMTVCNDQAAVDHGEESSKMVGRHIRELIKIPDDKIIILHSLNMKKDLYNKEIMDRNYYSVSTRVILNKDGSVKRVIGIFSFLKSIKESEKQNLAGRIAAGIAHEIRNPLTTVRGYLQLLADRLDPQTSDLFTSLLIPEIDRANKIITDFLDIAKPAASLMEPVRLSYFMNDYLKTFLHAQGKLYDTDILLILDKEAEDLSILGNRDELLQVFLNLLHNSIQAKNADRLIISIEAQKTESDIRFTFRDNGTGIAPGHFPHIFDPFFSTKDTGTGLGLSVSKKIIENHGGLLTADTDKEGAVFYIELPALKKDPASSI